MPCSPPAAAALGAVMVLPNMLPACTSARILHSLMQGLSECAAATAQVEPASRQCRAPAGKSRRALPTLTAASASLGQKLPQQQGPPADQLPIGCHNGLAPAQAGGARAASSTRRPGTSKSTASAARRRAAVKSRASACLVRAHAHTRVLGKHSSVICLGVAWLCSDCGKISGVCTPCSPSPLLLSAVMVGTCRLHAAL